MESVVAVRQPVLMSEVARDVLRRVQDVQAGVLSPADAFPWLKEPETPPVPELQIVAVRPAPVPPSKRRRCVDCRRDRRIKFFYVSLKAKGGYAIRCKPCWQKKAAESRARSPERAKEWQKNAWRRYAEAGKWVPGDERYKLSLKGHVTSTLSAHHQRAKREGLVHDLTAADLRSIRRSFFGRCAYCTQPLARYYFDHVVPVQMMGPDVPANLVPACRPCNRVKAGRNIYLLIRDAVFPRKRLARVLRHCAAFRGWELVMGRLDELEREVGPYDEAVQALEPWLRRLVRAGILAKEDALAALVRFGEEGLLDLKEQYSDVLDRVERVEADEHAYA